MDLVDDVDTVDDVDGLHWSESFLVSALISAAGWWDYAVHAQVFD